MNVKQVIDGIIATEGGFVDNKDDRGGATKYGITEKVARAAGYTGAMQDLPRELAYNIYLNDYWVAPGFAKVAELSEAIANELCDTGVNCGVGAAKPMLQRALNLFNKQGTAYIDITVDGSIGPGTMRALATFLATRGSEGERVLLKTLNVLQAARYIEITEARPQNETFIYGWMLNRVEI
jgi:lysozyme family protein